MACSVGFSDAAREDLLEISRQIALDNPPAALRWIDRIEARCESLANFPLRAQRHDARYRRLIEGEYLIFYSVDDEAAPKRVSIARIMHGARDLSSAPD